MAQKTSNFDILEKVGDLAPSGAFITRGVKVLLVEDEDAIREDTSLLLASLGCSVTTAATGRGAVAKFLQHQGQFDVLLTDILIPELNGSQLAQVLRTRNPNLKVIFMSGHSGGSLSSSRNFIEKPFSRDVLADRLRKVMEGGF